MSLRLVIFGRNVLIVADRSDDGRSSVSASTQGSSLEEVLQTLLGRDFDETLGFPGVRLTAPAGSEMAFRYVARFLAETHGVRVVLQGVNAVLLCQRPSRLRDFESARTARGYLVALEFLSNLSAEAKRGSDLVRSAFENFESVTQHQMARAQRYGSQASYLRKLRAAHSPARRTTLLARENPVVFQSNRTGTWSSRTGAGCPQTPEQAFAIGRGSLSCAGQEMRHAA